MFYTTIALASTAWAMAFPNVFLTAELVPLRVLIFIALPGFIWLMPQDHVRVRPSRR